jgi:hypothetical protein
VQATYKSNNLLSNFLTHACPLYLGPQAPRPPLAAIHGLNPTLLVKYNYKSNADQPGGFPELTVKQGQKVTFLNVHESEALWWNVKDEDSGQSGYIPGSYVMVRNMWVITKSQMFASCVIIS